MYSADADKTLGLEESGQSFMADISLIWNCCRCTQTFNPLEYFPYFVSAWTKHKFNKCPRPSIFAQQNVTHHKIGLDSGLCYQWAMGFSRAHDKSRHSASTPEQTVRKITVTHKEEYGCSMPWKLVIHGFFSSFYDHIKRLLFPFSKMIRPWNAIYIAFVKVYHVRCSFTVN